MKTREMIDEIRRTSLSSDDRDALVKRVREKDRLLRRRASLVAMEKLRPGRKRGKR